MWPSPWGTVLVQTAAQSQAQPLVSCALTEEAQHRLRKSGPRASSLVPSFCPHPAPHSQTLCGLNLVLWQRGLETTLEDELLLPSLPDSGTRLGIEEGDR